MRKLGVALMVLALACGSSGGSSKSPWPEASGISDQSFTGALGDGSVLSVHVGGTAPAVVAGNLAGVAATVLQATGVVRSAGGTQSLTGSYDPGTGTLSLSGGVYTITGTYSSGAIVGTVEVNGTTYDFAVAIGDASAVSVYCGTYVVTSTSEGGTFMLMISGGHAWGTADTAEGGVTFSGSVSGSSISMSVSGHSGTIAGTVDGAAVSGTFSNSDGGGTWQGSSGACPSGT